MNVTGTDIDGHLLIELQTHRDDRGFFQETFRSDLYAEAGIVDSFVQENFSYSVANVLRGMHFRRNRPQAQIVTVLEGRVFDVVVDIRRGSETFGVWQGAELHPDGIQQAYMAPGLAHGFFVLSSSASLHYKVSEYFDASDEHGFAWDDRAVGIEWPTTDSTLSSRDRAHPSLETALRGT